jgi:hypothetical protein
MDIMDEINFSIDAVLNVRNLTKKHKDKVLLSDIVQGLDIKRYTTLEESLIRGIIYYLSHPAEYKGLLNSVYKHYK